MAAPAADGRLCAGRLPACLDAFLLFFDEAWAGPLSNLVSNLVGGQRHAYFFRSRRNRQILFAPVSVVEYDVGLDALESHLDGRAASSD
jgi:hypothetical protein